MMKLSNHLEPDLEQARAIFHTIKDEILQFTDKWDKNPETAETEHQLLVERLTKLTNKDLSEYNLWEWWEADGIDLLAFQIALPHPMNNLKISYKELKELLTRIKVYIPPTEQEENDGFLILAWSMKPRFYENLLKLNFTNYDEKYFMRNKDEEGNYFEYSIEEVLEFMWVD